MQLLPTADLCRALHRLLADWSRQHAVLPNAQTMHKVTSLSWHQQYRSVSDLCNNPHLNETFHFLPEESLSICSEKFVSTTRCKDGRTVCIPTSIGPTATNSLIVRRERGGIRFQMRPVRPMCSTKMASLDSTRCKHHYDRGSARFQLRSSSHSRHMLESA